MFENATLKLTVWYLLIIMVISVLFSALIYRSATSELRFRLEGFPLHAPTQIRPFGDVWDTYSERQASEAAHNILVNLLYINCLILAAGGVASYLMARKTLQPLKEALESESRFVSDASHELRTPLAAMKTELEVMLRDPNASTQELREQLESDLEEVNKLTLLSQTLLTLSKMEHQTLPLEKLDLRPVVAAVVDRYDKPRARISVDLPKSPLYINGHEPSVEELITILIDNALKYSPAGSEIPIVVSTQKNKISFAITNSGKGIAQKDLPHIFERFYRADNARTSSEKMSFGLGLSLATTIAQLHHSELSVTSGRDKLTTFEITFPNHRNTKAKNQILDI